MDAVQIRFRHASGRAANKTNRTAHIDAMSAPRALRRRSFVLSKRLLTKCRPRPSVLFRGDGGAILRRADLHGV